MVRRPARSSDLSEVAGPARAGAERGRRHAPPPSRAPGPASTGTAQPRETTGGISIHGESQSSFVKPISFDVPRVVELAPGVVAFLCLLVRSRHVKKEVHQTSCSLEGCVKRDLHSEPCAGPAEKRGVAGAAGGGQLHDPAVVLVGDGGRRPGAPARGGSRIFLGLVY